MRFGQRLSRCICGAVALARPLTCGGAFGVDLAVGPATANPPLEIDTTIRSIPSAPHHHPHVVTIKMSAIAGPSSRPDIMPGRALAEKNLLDHVNKIRQTPTFVGFEQVLRMTGDDWIDSMIEQAKDIRSKWA